ncbi:MAG: MarR family winged helix-turn-helix transcriptional regulator [Caulobacteraceae bacterium]
MPSRTSAVRQAQISAAPRESIDLGILGGVLGFRLRRIQNHLAQTFAQSLAKRDMKSGQFSALAIISANPGISQIELARFGGFDKASVVTLIDDLQSWGWAVRERVAQDRRRHSLFATPTGEKVLTELLEVAKANEAKIANALSQQELEALYVTLDRIYDVCFVNEQG